MTRGTHAPQRGSAGASSARRRAGAMMAFSWTCQPSMKAARLQWKRASTKMEVLFLLAEGEEEGLCL